MGNTTFIEAKWGYRTKVSKYYNSSVNSDGPEPSKPSSWDAFPWTDCKEKKYRLLILSPLSQYDFALWKDAAGITKCISEVVLSGAHFGYTEGGRVMSLNDQSIDRYGMQMITNNSTYNYTPELQLKLTCDYIQNELCKSIEATPGNPKGGMVHRMACVRVMDDCTQNTLDMDAIVASYFWKPELFEFKQRLVAFDELTGLTYSECSRVGSWADHWAGRSVCLCQGTAKVLKCFEANLATDFHAINWFHAIKDELIRHP